MPFTAAHPMAVLPVLRWRWLDATCLVIGAMAPDFEYFAYGEQRGNFGHTLLGIPLWDLPVTLALAAAWHFMVKDALRLVGPVAVARRTTRTARWPGSWVAIVASAVIGIATHLAWDSFTHDGGWGERTFAGLLDRRVQVPVIGALPGYRVIQYGSSVIGLVVVTWFAIRAIRGRAPVALPDAPRAWPRVVFAACVALGIAGVTARAVWLLHDRDPGSLVVAPLSGLCAGTLVASASMFRTVRAWRLTPPSS